MGITKEQMYQNQKKDLQKVHILKLMELYNIYYEQAKTDSSVFKAFNDVSKELFTDADDSDVSKMLAAIKDDDLDG